MAVSVTTAGVSQQLGAHPFLDLCPSGSGHALVRSEIVDGMESSLQVGLEEASEHRPNVADVEEELEAAAAADSDETTRQEAGPRRKKKFSAARAFFEGQQRVAATAGLASPTGSAPRVRRSRVNEMAKLFQAGRPIPVEEFVVDLDQALPDGASPSASPERELPPPATNGCAEKAVEFERPLAVEATVACEKEVHPPATTPSEDMSMIGRDAHAAETVTEEAGPPATNSISAAEEESSPQADGVKSDVDFSRLPQDRDKDDLAAATFVDADCPPKQKEEEGEEESRPEDARPPVEGREAASEEVAKITRLSTFCQLEPAGEGGEEEEVEEEEEGGSVTSGSVKEDVVTLLAGANAVRPPQPLPQPQRMTISSSTESLTEDQYEDVPVTDSSDEFASDYEQLHNCTTKERPISLESFAGCLASNSVPTIDEVPVDSANTSVTSPGKFERAKEVGVENGVHYLEDGHFFFQMEPRTPSDSEDEDEDYPSTPAHEPTRLRFSEEPITVYSTHSPSEYDRRNELIDPISANAEYELEKQLARMHIFPVRLNKGLRGLGISIMGVGLGRAPGVEKLGIFIKGITAGGPAEQDGQLKVLDQIVEVNGRSLVGVTQAEAAEVLRNTHGEVQFLIGRERPELVNCPGQGSSIVRLVERSIRQQECAQGGTGLPKVVGSAPLAETEDLRSPSDRSPSQPSKPFLPSLVPDSPTEPPPTVSRLRDIEEQNEDMRNELEDLNAKVALLDGEEAVSRFEALRSRLLAVEAREKAVRGERDLLERQLETSRASTLQREAALNDQIAALNGDLEQSQERVRCLRAENAELSMQLREAESRIERISSEMNDQVRRLEGELEALREASGSPPPEAAQRRSSLDFSAERHRAAVAQNGSLASRRPPSRLKGRQSSTNDDITFSNGHSGETAGGERRGSSGGESAEKEDEEDGGFEDMAAVFSSHSPDSTLARGPRSGGGVLPGAADVLSMMPASNASQTPPDSLTGSQTAQANIRGMSVDELCGHLRQEELSWAETYVRYNGVDGARFLSLDTSDMKSMGISSAADRAKLKKRIKEMNKAMERCRPSV